MGLHCHKSVYTAKQIKLDTLHHHQCTHLTMVPRGNLFLTACLARNMELSKCLLPISNATPDCTSVTFIVYLNALDHQSPNNTLTFPDSKQWVAHWLCRCLRSDDQWPVCLSEDLTSELNPAKAVHAQLNCIISFIFKCSCHLLTVTSLFYSRLWPRLTEMHSCESDRLTSHCKTNWVNVTAGIAWGQHSLRL